MISPSAVICWPAHCDYPLFRYNLHRFQKYFKHIYIAFNYAYREEDYRNFIKADLSFCTFIESKRTGPDWRDNAINDILDVAVHNTQITHFLFLEQDFLIQDDHFWDTVLNADYDFIYYDEQDRIHPAFALIEKDLVFSTHLDFSAHPDDLFTDHFGVFFKEVAFNCEDYRMVELKDLGLKEKEDYYHMAGSTQNISSFKNNQPFYKPHEFLAYVSNSLNLPIQIPEKFYELLKRIEYELLKRIETEKGKGESNGIIRRFFP